MTCIVGVVKDGVVYIGGDSAGVSGLRLIKRKDSKVFKRKGFIIGYTSSFRMGQLLRFKLDPPILQQKEINKMFKIICKNLIFVFTGVCPHFFGDFSVSNSWQPWAVILGCVLLINLREYFIRREIRDGLLDRLNSLNEQ